MACVACIRTLASSHGLCPRCGAARAPQRGQAPMDRFWAHHSTKAKEQHQPHDYYYNYGNQQPNLKQAAAVPGRLARLRAVPGQLLSSVAQLVRRVVSPGPGEEDGQPRS